MKPKKIRVTQTSNPELFTEGKVYDVSHWDGEYPYLIDNDGCCILANLSKWEPVSEFNHGDPVWAWDDERKHKGIYLCENPNNDIYPFIVMGPCVYNTAHGYKHVEHRKPQMTLQELADKADVNLDEVEIVD